MSDQGAEEQASKCEETMDDLELKMELDKLLESVRSIEQVLEEKLSSNNAKDYPDCCKCIVRMNRSCREIDRLLDSNYFEDSALQQAVSQVKRVFRQERGFKIVRDLNSVSMHHYSRSRHVVSLSSFSDTWMATEKHSNYFLSVVVWTGIP